MVEQVFVLQYPKDLHITQKFLHVPLALNNLIYSPVAQPVCHSSFIHFFSFLLPSRDHILNFFSQHILFVLVHINPCSITGRAWIT